MTRIGISGGQLKHLNLEQIIQKADEYRADGLELHWGANIPSLREVGRLKELLDASHKTVDVLNSSLFHSPGELEDLAHVNATLDQCLSAAEQLSSRFVLIYCACPPRDNLDDPAAQAEMERYLDALKPWAAGCAEKGITLVVENFFDSLMRSPQATLRLLQKAEPMGLRLAFDPSNYYNSGAEPYPLAYHLLKDYMAVLHVKNSARYESALYAPDVKVAERAMPVVFLPLAKGAVNWEGLSEDLLRSGFDGPMIVEPNCALKHLDAAFTENIQYLKSRGFGDHA